MALEDQRSTRTSSSRAPLVYVVGHRHPDADSVCSAIAYAHLENVLGNENVRPARAGEIDEETAFVLDHFGVPVPELLADARGRHVILVDHNEAAQAVPNIRQATILEIWEHHRLGDLRPPNPIVFHCEPIGATATLIAEQYFLHDITPPRAIAGLLLAAILSDTVLLRSPTVSEKDRRFVARLTPLAEVDRGFGEEMLRRKTASIARRSPAEIVRGDYKEFRFGGEPVGIAQVEVTEPDAVAHEREGILREMRQLARDSRLAVILLMVTDVRACASDLWVVGARSKLVEQAFGAMREGVIHVPGCMSRKRQVVPRLEACFAEAICAGTTGTRDASQADDDVVRPHPEATREPSRRAEPLGVR